MVDQTDCGQPRAAACKLREARIAEPEGIKADDRRQLWADQQWGRPRTRRRKLLGLGIRRDEVKKASRSRKGHWRMSQNSLVRKAMTNSWLSDQGVPSIEEMWKLVHYPNG